MQTNSDKEWLKRLGAGESVQAVCAALGIAPVEFEKLWKETLAARLPAAQGTRAAKVNAAVDIERDKWGIPHIYAASDSDLFFGLGFAMAQDRLFQLDYLRRKGLGRWAEILGADGLAPDLVARTGGLNRIAAAEWERLPEGTRATLESFARGINAVIESTDVLPIEFDLLDYRPEPWSPIDSLAIESEFRWYLTGRFPVIVMPELAKRTLGTGPLYQEFILGEADEESIIQPGEYVPRPVGNALRGVPERGFRHELRTEPVGSAVGDPDGATGSNNWVLAGSRSTTGLPLVASDPHIAMEAVSCWYEAHLCGGSYNVAGIAYAGLPAIMFGRNERVAWGITNNICSLRDLYQERTDPAHPDCFLYDGQWEPARQLTETIRVRDAAPVVKTIRFSRNGPLVNEILPSAAEHTGHVSLKWLGNYQGGWLTSLLAMDKSASAAEFREALRPWHVPTFSLVFADVDGHFGLHTAGRIPVRNTLERGYRPGWEPDHQWQGLIPFEEMPQLTDPPRGWIGTANNRLAPNDFPYPLHGCWSAGWRAVRIRELIEAKERHSPADVGDMQQDAKSLRAAALVPPLVATLESETDPRVCEAAGLLAAWNHDIETDSPAAAIFNVFFARWCRAVAQERFEPAVVELMSAGVNGCAARLLSADAAGWFAPGTRERRIVGAFHETLDFLTARFGTAITAWRWGDLHPMPLAHVLSTRGDLGRLLGQGRPGVRGDMVTVFNTGSGPDFVASSGAGYRLLADLASSPPSLLACDGQSQSGHPGSPHYRDQFEVWNTGGYHELFLDRAAAAASIVAKWQLTPES